MSAAAQALVTAGQPTTENDPTPGTDRGSSGTAHLGFRPSRHDAARLLAGADLPILALWAHLLATVILVGYYAVMTVIVLPSLSALPALPGMGIVAAMERRAMPALVASLVVFLATGIYLLTSDPRYAGPGNVAGDWATQMLVKHLVVVADAPRQPPPLRQLAGRAGRARGHAVSCEPHPSRPS